MTKQTINYEGLTPLFLMVSKDPTIWEEAVSIEIIGGIWEKLNLKPKRYINVEEQSYISVYAKAFDNYTKLVHLYNSYPESLKNQMANEWNANTRIEDN